MGYATLSSLPLYLGVKSELVTPQAAAPERVPGVSEGRHPHGPAVSGLAPVPLPERNESEAAPGPGETLGGAVPCARFLKPTPTFVLPGGRKSRIWTFWSKLHTENALTAVPGCSIISSSPDMQRLLRDA